MSISYITKQNQRPIGSELLISGELHTIGITGLQTITPNQIRLIEVPLQELPSSIVISGYTEVYTNPSGSQFQVDYSNGRITFDPSASGTVSVTYKGRGSIIDAEDANELQIPVGLGLNFNGTVSAGKVAPTSISTQPTDDFSFPRNVTTIGNLTSDGLLTSAGSTLFGLATLTNPISIATSQVDTHSGLVITTSADISIIIPTPTNTTLGRFFTILHNETSTGTLNVNSQSIGVRKGATFIWDGLAWIPVGGAGSFNLVTGNPGSFQTGDTWFDTVTNQFKGWNGTNIVILG